MPSLARLLMPREEAARQLRERIDKGMDLVDPVSLSLEFDRVACAYGDLTKWDLVNRDLLQRMFVGGHILDEYLNIDRAINPRDQNPVGGLAEQTVQDVVDGV